MHIALLLPFDKAVLDVLRQQIQISETRSAISFKILDVLSRRLLKKKVCRTDWSHRLSKL